MTTPGKTDTATYEPNADQKERAKALRRFNLLFIYVPVGIAAFIVLLLLALLLWGSLSPNIAGTREFVSGLADIIIILTIIPLILIFAIVPLLFIAFLVARRQQPRPPYSRVQLIFWRVDTLASRAADRTASIVPKLAQPVVVGHAWVAFVKAFWGQIKNIVKWS